MNNIQMVKKLRAVGYSIADAANALKRTDYNYDAALQLLNGTQEIVFNKEPTEGRIETYNHNGRIAVIVEVLCETDFVAKNDDFKNLCKELALQIAGTNPYSVEELLSQVYIRDASMLVSDLINQLANAVKENIKVSRFIRYSK